MNITYFTERPTELAYYMAKAHTDNRRKSRVIIAVNDAEGRTLGLVDEELSLKALKTMWHSKPRVAIQPNNVLANAIRPATWTVVVIQDENVTLRTVPLKKVVR